MSLQIKVASFCSVWMCMVMGIHVFDHVVIYTMSYGGNHWLSVMDFWMAYFRSVYFPPPSLACHSHAQFLLKSVVDTINILHSAITLKLTPQIYWRSCTGFICVQNMAYCIRMLSQNLYKCTASLLIVRYVQIAVAIMLWWGYSYCLALQQSISLVHYQG